MPILQQKHFVRVVLCPTSQWLKMLQTHQLPFALSLFGLDQHCPIHFHIVDNVLPDLQAPKQCNVCCVCFFSNASVSCFLHDALMFAFIPSSEARLGAFGALPTNRLHHAHLASIGTGQDQCLEHFVEQSL